MFGLNLKVCPDRGCIGYCQALYTGVTSYLTSQLLQWRECGAEEDVLAFSLALSPSLTHERTQLPSIANKHGSRWQTRSEQCAVNVALAS